LVAEDNLLNQTTIQDMLSYLGHEVMIVNNGLEAIEAVKHDRYDAILLDFHMPLMNGAEAAQIMRQTLPHPQPAIVGATGSTEPEELEKCLAVGMNTTILKPFSLEKLQSLLASIPQLGASFNSSVDPIDVVTDEEPIDLTHLPPVILDRQYFKDYSIIFGEKGTDKIVERIQKFLIAMPEHLQVIQSAMTRLDREAIFEEAHKFKPMVGFIGGTELSELCGVLEREARQSSSDNCLLFQSQLTLECTRLQLALETEIEILLAKKSEAMSESVEVLN
jgi:two-component system, NarL family, sensor histidine kinase EvgS